MNILSKNKNSKTDYNSIDVKNNMDVAKQKEEIEDSVKRERLDKVIKDAPKKRKKSLVGRLVTGIVGPEGLPGIGSYVAEEIIVPAIKNIVVDAVTSGINMVMYGENRPQSRPRNYSGGYSRYQGPRPTTNYTSRYTSQRLEPASSDRLVVRGGKQGVEEYVIEERVDAAHVLTTLTENADMYGTVSVADFYDLIGVPSNYTDNNYGWTLETISRASIRPVRGGYVIQFPPTDVI